MLKKYLVDSYFSEISIPSLDEIIFILNFVENIFYLDQCFACVGCYHRLKFSEDKRKSHLANDKSNKLAKQFLVKMANLVANV